MKKTLLLILFFTALIANAQASKTEITVESVSKKWEFSDLINPKLSKEEYKENKELLEATQIEFRKDMTFTFSFVADLEGTWTLDKNIITTTDRRGKNTWTIHKISPNEIIMSRNDAEQRIIFKTKT
ncbi:hypothetical protein [Flavobacterium suncheonense]|uniref:Lipocalin-like domain-containing protein n=1 Tax=Flavobacterium suncheonense GH29-5 = DSM 17707 TaxID=1121899 RepID=A0A0A2MF79_9FLAO|nr:hypothetical protein [Flavobacterium suncheonense]KGO90231.1 hypothetical protein Q764_04025 [Flavobacterium suncheonense GH29-5 = DSM 17707]